MLAKDSEEVHEGRESKILVSRPKGKIGKRQQLNRRGVSEARPHVDDHDQKSVRPWHQSREPAEIGPPAWAVETRQRLAHIPILSLEELRALPDPQPKEGGVYFLWRENALVYVGRARSVLWRSEFFLSQARYSRVRYYQQAIQFDRITLLKFDDDLSKEAFHFATKDYEHAYIAQYLPEYNSDYKAAGNWS